jgi:hypothetical protein
MPDSRSVLKPKSINNTTRSDINRKTNANTSANTMTNTNKKTKANANANVHAKTDRDANADTNTNMEGKTKTNDTKNHARTWDRRGSKRTLEIQPIQHPNFWIHIDISNCVTTCLQRTALRHATHRLYLSGTTLPGRSKRTLETRTITITQAETNVNTETNMNAHTDTNANTTAGAISDLSESILVDNSDLSESILCIRNIQIKIPKTLQRDFLERDPSV